MEPGAGQSDPFEFDVPEGQPLQELGPAVAEVMELAEKLEPADRTQLIIWLWGTLPTDSRTAIMAFGLENLRKRSHDGFAYQCAPHASPGPSPLWQMLFDPKRTSGLYSAPRRFDLATIFVVTAAYSILFGAMSALDSTPIAKVLVGILVTTVAVSQALYHNLANPRGVSIITGAITLSVLLLLLAIYGPGWWRPSLVFIVFFGLIGGALVGYLCGVLVGGVFLVADALRRRFERPAEETQGEESTEPAE